MDIALATPMTKAIQRSSTFLFSPRFGGLPESRAAASFNATVIELPRVSQYSALSGITRRDQKAADRPVVIAIKPGDHQRGNRRCRGQDRTKMQPTKAGRHLLGAGGRVVPRLTWLSNLGPDGVIDNGRSAGCRDRLILFPAAAADADGADD
jgi:hypothetical protein